MNYYVQEWTNFLCNRAEDIEKSRPSFTPSMALILIGIFTGIVGWYGEFSGFWEKLVAGILVAISLILIVLGAYIYIWWFYYKNENISTEKDNVITLTAMILGERFTTPEEIYDMWQTRENKEYFEERVEEIESEFKIRHSPENVNLEDVKRGFKHLDEEEQVKYMNYLKENTNEEIEVWLIENYGELSTRVTMNWMCENTGKN